MQQIAEIDVAVETVEHRQIAEDSEERTIAKARREATTAHCRPNQTAALKRHHENLHHRWQRHWQRGSFPIAADDLSNRAN